MLDHCPTPWLGARRGYFIDWLTQRWVQFTGRTVPLAETPWLDGPIGKSDRIGADYFEQMARESGLALSVNAPGSGLTADFRALDGSAFDTSRVNARVVDFYEHTSTYDLDVWSQWCGFFKPFGWLIAFLFSRRLQQLNLPIAPLDTSRGITSQIVQLRDGDETRCTGWLRKRVQDENVIYCGIYSTFRVPNHPSPCVRVVFPLPNGSATVILKPTALPDGSLELLSSGRRFGDPGFYFVVRRTADTVWTRYVRTMRERIHVYVDPAGDLRTDHTLTLWRMTFLKLHYRMRKRG